MTPPELDVLMACLAQKRPVFHSEADFQHALAWEMRLRDQEADVRLEVPASLEEQKRASIDMRVQNGPRTLFWELKYKTASSDISIRDERFQLKKQGAQDQGKYDFLKDISRLEAFADAQPSSLGYAILLTNDASYWNHRRKADPIDEAFGLIEGRRLSGSLSWASHASVGSKKGREAPIVLRSSYVVRWKDYPAASHMGCPPFRYLAICVNP